MFDYFREKKHFQFDKWILCNRMTFDWLSIEKKTLFSLKYIESITANQHRFTTDIV